MPKFATYGDSSGEKSELPYHFFSQRRIYVVGGVGSGRLPHHRLSQ